MAAAELQECNSEDASSASEALSGEEAEAGESEVEPQVEPPKLLSAVALDYSGKTLTDEEVEGLARKITEGRVLAYAIDLRRSSLSLKALLVLCRALEGAADAAEARDMARVAAAARIPSSDGSEDGRSGKDVEATEDADSVPAVEAASAGVPDATGASSDNTAVCLTEGFEEGPTEAGEPSRPRWQPRKSVGPAKRPPVWLELGNNPSFPSAEAAKLMRTHRLKCCVPALRCSRRRCLFNAAFHVSCQVDRSGRSSRCRQCPVESEAAAPEPSSRSGGMAVTFLEPSDDLASASPRDPSPVTASEAAAPVLEPAVVPPSFLPAKAAEATRLVLAAAAPCPVFFVAEQAEATQSVPAAAAPWPQFLVAEQAEAVQSVLAAAAACPPFLVAGQAELPVPALEPPAACPMMLPEELVAALCPAVGSTAFAIFSIGGRTSEYQAALNAEPESQSGPPPAEECFQEIEVLLSSPLCVFGAGCVLVRQKQPPFETRWVAVQDLTEDLCEERAFDMFTRLGDVKGFYLMLRQVVERLGGNVVEPERLGTFAARCCTATAKDFPQDPICSPVPCSFEALVEMLHDSSARIAAGVRQPGDMYGRYVRRVDYEY